MGATFQAAPGITAIDTKMAGRFRVTSAYLLDADQPALVETGPTTSATAVVEGLRSLGVGPNDLAHVVVTHIHLDHAGGAGRIAALFPGATVWVHERGAGHLADPSKLVASATRLYGEQRLGELFGPVDPVPPDRVRSVGEGDRIVLGGRHVDVLATPGHASHHIALVDSATGALFAGDALGIHLPDAPVLRPATPPPDVDVELGVDSITRIAARAGPLLMFSHFGPVEGEDDVEELCDLAARRLRKWADVVRDGMQHTDDVARLAELLEAGTADELEDVDGEAARERFSILAPTEMNAAGLARYWRKRAERDRSSAAG